MTDDDGAPVVLELELLDPALFLDTDPAAASRFADVLGQLIPLTNGCGQRLTS